MRCVAGVGWLLLVGCNQIFGLTPAKTWDASIDVPPDTPHVVFTWQLAASLPTGAADLALGYPTFSPSHPPQIRIATLEGQFQSADYSFTDGWVLIPRSYLGTDDAGHPQIWRFEYTLPADVLPDDAPHEVQWSPDDKLGHLVVPLVGRLDRAAVPSGSGYTITPTNPPPAGYKSPRVLTTGLWTAGDVPAFAGATVDYDFVNSASLSGTKGRPDPAQGDLALLVDYATDTVTGCRAAIGSGLFDGTLQANVHTVRSVTWDSSKKPVASESLDLAFLDRLTADPMRGTLMAPQSGLLYGVAASTSFPGLAGTVVASLPIPVPVMQTLLQCPYTASSMPMTSQPPMLDSFPRVLYARLVASRQVLGASLYTAMETVITAPVTGGFKISFPAPLATQMKLDTPGGTVDLAGADDQVAIGVPSGALTLRFAPEPGADLRADYYDIVLHKIAAGKLTVERVYTVTQPRVRIDGALLQPASDYVFEIRSFKGHGMASRGDFASVDYPYGGAVVFTRTFKTP